MFSDRFVACTGRSSVPKMLSLGKLCRSNCVPISGPKESPVERSVPIHKINTGRWGEMERSSVSFALILAVPLRSSI